MIKHVIFDCFGTLIDTGSGSVKAACAVLLDIINTCAAAHGEKSLQGYPLTAAKNVDLIYDFLSGWKDVKKEMEAGSVFADEKTLFVRSLRAMLADKHPALKAAVGKAIDGVYDPDRIAKPMINNLFGERHAFPEVGRVLTELENMGIDTALASNTDDDSLEHFLNQNGMSFDIEFTSESIETYKPDPRFYSFILDCTGWKAEECLFAGDSYDEDIVGPHKIGMKTLLVVRKGSVMISSGLRPDRIMTSLELLPEILAKGEI